MTTTNRPFCAAATAAALSFVLAACAQMSEQSEPPAQPAPAARPEPVAGPESVARPDSLAAAATPGCEVMDTQAQQNTLLLNAPVFRNPPVNDFSTNPALIADLQVEFKSPVLAGCKTKLRQYAGNKYDGRPVGPTMLIRPGQTYRADINNQLPSTQHAMFGQERFFDTFGGHGGNSTMFGYVPPERTHINHNQPMDFNTTNLHTHGWHVSPIGHSDNIFAAIEPGDPVYPQRVELPKDHPGGTFWYHAHLHGSTAIQVSSGMAGALIVDDATKGLDSVPQIAAAEDLIFVLQQLAYNEQGVVNEDYSNLSQGGYSSLNRPVFVNGLAYPVIEVKVNEVQRWRFIHAGITDGIFPRLVTSLDTPVVKPLYEIALDGLPTGTMPSLDYATLSPGYRVDVLAQFSDVKVGDTLYLIDYGQTRYVDDDQTKGPNMRYILAQIKVVSGYSKATVLPTEKQITAALADYVNEKWTYNPDDKDPYQYVGPLNPIGYEELLSGKKQVVHYFATNTYECPKAGGSCWPKPQCQVVPGEEPEECKPNAATRVYMTCDGKDQNNNWLCMNFNSSADYARTLALDTASQWQVSGNFGGGFNSSGQTRHTFHVHVNPFQVQRKYVDKSTGDRGEQWVWKDTLKTPVVPGVGGDYATLRSRYTVFTGAFVQHCHVLHHEDRGMMQVVEIVPSDADIMEMMDAVEPDAVEKMIIEQLKH